jgi:uncharacterized protein with gpF-like domain
VRQLDTRARTVWPKGTRPKVLKGTDLAIPVGVSERYSRKLRALTREMVATTKHELENLFRHPDVQAHLRAVAPIQYAMDISPASQSRILTNKLKDRFEGLFAQASKPSAEMMVNEADDASKAQVATSLRQLAQGVELKVSLTSATMAEFKKAIIANNVSLIKSIPSEFFRDVQQAVLSSITDGKGLEDLSAFFKNADHDTKYDNQWERRANNIALDQTRKAYNGLNKIRMSDSGVRKFQWIHSGGGLHPREHHLLPWPEGLNGGIFSFDKLPIIDESTGERGIPGQAINCKCTMVPVVDFKGQ